MERFEEIERSIITTYRSRLWSKFTKAINEYKLINSHDKICVCISGGKDSMLMAKLFQELKKHSNIDFDVEYLVMNPGYNEDNINVIKNNLKILNINAMIIDTDIFDVSTKLADRPCYMCARMRRGALYRIAKDLGCNKIALGHHYDDVIVTTLMNMLNSGSFQTMLPKLHSDNYKDMQLIRPLYLIREKDIITWQKAWDLNFIRCACKFTDNLEYNSDETISQRAETKKLIDKLLENNEFVEKNIFKSAQNVNIDKILGYKENGKYHSFLDNYED